MDNIELGSMLKDSFGSLQRYIELQLKYNKLLLTQKLSEILSLIVLFVILLGLSGFILIFLSLAFVNWFGEHYGSVYTGFLWVSLFYAIIAILIFLFRKPLLFNPLRNLFGNILFREEAANNVEIPFKTKEELQINITRCKAELQIETDELKSKIELLGDKLTLNNILISAGKSLYQTFVTTSNIVKVSALLAGKILNRSNKSKKNKSSDKEEND